MAKAVHRDNRRTGYINVGLTATLIAECQLAANECGEALPDFVSIACQQRLASLNLERRNNLYRDACQRAAERRMPVPPRWEFDNMMGWD